jgi:antitoxin component of RelBE/YafQ-DinJ toxin-antitoxin module
MAETTNLNIRIYKELKEQAEVFFNELGLKNYGRRKNENLLY